MTDITASARPGASSVLDQIVGWLRVNLFSSWLNSALTILCGALLLWTVPGFLNWAFFSAVYGAQPEEVCRATPEGACWAFIHEKFRFILFGTYPFDEHWRPALACVLLTGGLVVSAFRQAWRPWLIGFWAVLLVTCAILMAGGVFGLSAVENTKWNGLPLTLMLSVFGCAIAFPLAVGLALGRRSNLPVIRVLCTTFIELIRGVPLITLLFMASFMLPLFMPEGLTIDKVLRAQVAIILFEAAYLAEAVRGGLQAIPKGQYEAADAMGLGYWRKMGLIILPQSLKISIPGIVNSFISLFKDTSLVLIISLFDLMLTTRAAIQDAPWRQYFVEGFLFIAAIYFIYCFAMSQYSQWLEKEIGAPRRR